jgi:hypothetical protein
MTIWNGETSLQHVINDTISGHGRRWLQAILRQKHWVNQGIMYEVLKTLDQHLLGETVVSTLVHTSDYRPTLPTVSQQMHVCLQVKINLNTTIPCWHCKQQQQLATSVAKGSDFNRQCTHSHNSCDQHKVTRVHNSDLESQFLKL